MDPVVYDFRVNEHGSLGELLAARGPSSRTLLLPDRSVASPKGSADIVDQDRTELEHFSAAARTDPALNGVLQHIIDRILPDGELRTSQSGSLEELLDRYGFDRVQHERIKADLRAGRIGLAQNRLPVNTTILDVEQGDVIESAGASRAEHPPSDPRRSPPGRWRC